MLTRYGPGKAVLLARFIPVVRTVANPVAGALGVPRRQFTVWQVTGGLLWSLGITAAGYGLGSAIPGVDQYLLPAIAVIVILSLLPLVLEARRARSAHRAAGRPGPGQPGPDQQRPARREPGQQDDGFWEYSEYRDSPQHQQAPQDQQAPPYQHTPRHARKGS
jgi:hypothetical protein